MWRSIRRLTKEIDRQDAAAPLSPHAENQRSRQDGLMSLLTSGHCECYSGQKVLQVGPSDSAGREAQRLAESHRRSSRSPPLLELLHSARTLPLVMTVSKMKQDAEWDAVWPLARDRSAGCPHQELGISHCRR